MAKQDQKPLDDGEIAMTLDEFCTRLSAHDKRVELIGGFHADELREGHVKDVESMFMARFRSFINKPRD